MARTTIRTEDITASEVTTAKMATDPTNATNLASGTVGSARMGSGSASSSTVLYGDGTWKAEPTTDTTSLLNDIATLALHSAVQNNQAAYNLTNAFIDQYEDSTGIDTTSTATRNANEYVSAGSSVTPDANTLLYMSCDGVNDGTTFTDEGPTGHTLVTEGNAHTDTAVKKFGTASLQCDGTGDAVTVTGSDASGSVFEFDSGDWTIECWMYPSSSGASEDYLASKIDTDRGAYDSWSWQITHSNRYLRIDLEPNSAPSGGATTLNSTASAHDTWQHVAVVREGSTVTHYRDGNGVGNMTFTDAIYPATGYKVAIGAMNDGNYSWLGYLDTFRISDIARYSGATYTVPTGPDATTSPFKYTTVSASGNYTSTTETATATVSKMGIVVLYKNAYGTATLDTDLIAEVSANGGTNYTSAPLTAAGTFSTGINIAVANDLTISNTGTAPKFKISFANQSLASKETQVHGVALLY